MERFCSFVVPVSYCVAGIWLLFSDFHSYPPSAPHIHICKGCEVGGFNERPGENLIPAVIWEREALLSPRDWAVYGLRVMGKSQALEWGFAV